MAERRTNIRAGERLQRLPKDRKAITTALDERIFRILGVVSDSSRLTRMRLDLSSPLSPYDRAVVSELGEIPPDGLAAISQNTVYAVAGHFIVSDSGRVSLETVTPAGHKPHVICLTNIFSEEADRVRDFGDRVVGGAVKIYGRTQGGEYLGTVADKVFVRALIG